MHRILCILPVFFLLYACGTSGDRQSGHVVLAPDAPVVLGDQKADRAESARPHLKAETALAKPSVCLEDLLQVADEHCPEIEAVREELNFGSAALWHSELSPNAATEGAPEVIPKTIGGVDQLANKFFSIKWPLVRGSRSTSAAVTAEAAENESRFFQLERKRREIFGKVHSLFIELLYFKQAQALHQQLVQDTREMHDTATVESEIKAVAEVEKIRPVLDVANLERESRRLAWERWSRSLQLESLLGGMHVPVERISGELPADLPEIEPARLFSSLEEHPAMRAARKDAEAAAHRLNQAKAQRKPDIDLRLAFGRDTIEGDRSVVAGLGLPLPLFDRGSKRSLEEAKYLAQKASDTVNVVQKNLRSELEAAHSEYLAALDQVAASRDQVLPAAEKAFAQTQEEYLSGKQNHLDLLDARLTLAQARLSYLAKLRQCNLAYAKIAAITGFQFEEAPET